MLRGPSLLSLVLAIGCSAPPSSEASADLRNSPRLAPLSHASAWEHLPRATPPLPTWARILVGSLPRTTALQLDLDYLHRVKNPLGPTLAGGLRWTVADANQCAYARQSAEADLTKAGFSADRLAQLGDPAAWSEDERIALDFARKLTHDGAAITDDEFAALLGAFGEDDTVAIVHTVAHANFQNRIFLALRLTAEPDGAAPPMEVRPTAESTYKAPPRPELPESVGPDHVPDHATVEWSDRSYDELRERLGRQKERPLRIAMPDQVRLARLPRPDRARVAGTVWGKVSMGYQPVLTSAWFQTMGAFDSEAKLDDVFANSVFWVITRENDCFY